MKYLKGFFVLVIVFALYACTAEEKLTHEEVFANTKLQFQTGETEQTVKSDIPLPGITYEGVTYTWTSSNLSVATITDDKILITRPATSNESLTITLTLTIKQIAVTKTFDLVVVKKDVAVEDKVYTVYVFNGDEETHYQVKAQEALIMDAPSKEGHTFKGYYTDSAFTTPWDEAVITKTMTIYLKWEQTEIVDVTAPVINGTHDFVLTIGDTVDYLLGVSIYDELGENIDVIVEDSGVDLQTPGTYQLYYSAKDAAGNEVTTVVTVTVEVLVEAVSLVETFDTASGSSSSYIDGELIGVNGIKWIYVGMRNDQTLDGKALTFGAKTTNSLKADIKGGIGSLSVQMTHAFSGDAERRVDVYINNVLVESFLVTTQTETYVKENIDVTGDFTLEFRNTGGYRVTLDNITIKTGSVSPDLRSVNKDIQSFNLASNILSAQTVTLPIVGINGSAITYAFKDVSNTNNALVNLSTGAVAMPLSNQVTVELIVTFTKGIESKSITHLMFLGEGAPATIKNALAQTGFVKTEGILTGFLVEATQIRAFFQDASGAMEVLFDLNQLTNLTIGYSYILKGDIVIGEYKLLSNVTSLQKGLVKSFNPTEVSSSTLTQNQSKFVYLNGLVQKDYTSGELFVATAGGVITVINHTSKSITALLGQEVSLNGHIVKVGQTYQIWVTNELTLDIRAFNSNLLNGYVLTSLNLATSIDASSDLVLPQTEPLFNLNIVWTSSNPSVLSSTGVITKPETATKVTLSFSIRKGTVVISEGTIIVDVLAGMNLSSYYASASGKQGEALKSALNSIISKAGSIPYSSTSFVLEDTDESLTNPGMLYLIYDSKLTKNVWDGASSWNKEHVWPQSKLGSASKSDLHNLRASTVSVNSNRGNLAFSSGSGSYGKSGSGWYPGDAHKGDVARIVLYMNLRWGLTISSGVIGDLNMFIKWHQEDPVDDFERNRNQLIFESTQANRNPYIDYPEFVNQIYGTKGLSSGYEDDTYTHLLTSANLEFIQY